MKRLEYTIDDFNIYLLGCFAKAAKEGRTQRQNHVNDSMSMVMEFKNFVEKQEKSPNPDKD